MIIEVDQATVEAINRVVDTLRRQGEQALSPGLRRHMGLDVSEGTVVGLAVRALESSMASTQLVNEIYKQREGDGDTVQDLREALRGVTGRIRAAKKGA